MYRIITIDGTEIGLTENVRYIKINKSSGAYVQTTAKEAIGVAYNSVPYNLLGHSEIDGAETVLVSNVDGGGEVAKLIANQDYIAMMSDIELDAEEETDETEEESGVDE